MAFTVQLRSNRLGFGDDVRYEVIPGGVLQITKADGEVILYSPAEWSAVEATPARSAYEAED
ncbi:MAG: hypothetical protein WAW17_24650 [Rhodococcus sp. (in: high G+C Gram-positive bacteria)]|uniref:hypothetical protein n=1 Tax=Rhodococcus sp. TaxID=1831 RepID=UPI003BAF74C4